MGFPKTLWTLWLAALCVACIPSLHPLYTTEDLIDEPLLVGIWTDGSDAFVFSPQGASAYLLTYEDSSGPGSFTVHLLQLGDHRLLDLLPDDALLSGRDDWYLSHYRPTHSFMAVEVSEESLALAHMDGQWLEKHLQSAPDDLAHEVIDGDIILTAGTEALQHFVVEHYDTLFHSFDRYARHDDSQ